MIEFTYTIKDSLGLHARPAGMLVKLVKETGCNVRISKNGQAVDASRLIAVMGMGVKCNDKVSITIEGNQEEEVLRKIKRFFEETL